MEVLALIPARSGSKSVIDKNIREVAGKPMLAWSIEHAKNSRLVNRVIVSTDSGKYADIARQYGAEVPFLRPDKYATDTATDLEVFTHALTWLEENEGYRPDIVVQLRPTYPKRNPQDIDRMIELLTENPSADSVRSVAMAGEVPYKMWKVPGGMTVREWNEKDEAQKQSAVEVSGTVGEADDAMRAGMALGRILPLIPDIPDCYNMPRQELPIVFYQNACIDVTRAATVLDKKSMTGERILGYLMKDNLDIDTELEVLKAENAMLKEKLAMAQQGKT